MSTGWQVLPGDSEVLAVHAATLQVEPAPSPTTDVFCAGHAMLGDGRLLVAGGTETFPHEMETMHEGFTGLRDTWIFRPGPETWVRAADLCHEPGKNTGGGRWYPTLVTLPDGRVWTAGSNHNGAQSFPEPNVDNRELRIELYEPPYVGLSRPEIADVPTTITCGEQFTLETPHANSIGRVALIRTGSVTHGFNPDQRYVACGFERSGPNRLEVSAPPTSAIAPPGYYLLFVVTRNRIPSEGRFVRVKRA